MIINELIGKRVSCGVCGHTDVQDYFKLADLGDHDVQFVCDGCEPLPDPPVSFWDNIDWNPRHLLGAFYLLVSMIILLFLAEFIKQ